STPSAASELVGLEQCDVEPLSAESIRALVAAAPPRPETDANIEPPFEDELPQGPAADPATVTAVTETERKYQACKTARDFPRLLALRTADQASEFLSMTTDEDKRALLNGQSTSGPRARPIELFPLRDVRLLPDGRVGAIVEFEVGSPNLHRQHHPSHFQTYKLVDGRWLIDEMIVYIATS